LLAACSAGAGQPCPTSCAPRAPCGAVASPAPSTAAVATERALLWEGLGNYSYRVSTDNAEAQRYFDQGLALCHAFNHDEAARSFAWARTLDPACAMAWWGEAYALGPNYNLQLPKLYGNLALQALREAEARKTDATASEVALIEALSARFSDPAPETIEGVKRLNAAYAQAMARVWAAHADDPEVGFLYADAVMNQRRWRLYNQEREPYPEALESVAVLERVLALNKDHPGAIHLYIHAVEPSKTPERAEAVADRLAALMPGAGHLVHMPSHIYMRVGRYADSVSANVRASALDRAYFARARGEQHVYHIYHLHNDLFLIWSEMFRGRDEAALRGCKQLMQDIPEHLADALPVTMFYGALYHVLVRFGRWEEMIAAPAPPAVHPFATAMWHYGRGVAFANTDRFEEARAEASAFEAAAAKVPKDLVVAAVVEAHSVLAVARHMLAGETEFKAGAVDKGLASLRRAVTAEDAIPYTEPNPWMFPTRHALGALLLEAGRVDEAAAAYREDLAKYPENGWSLHGLAECLERQGRSKEAAGVHARFQRAWADATIQLVGSCFCREGK
jgi:tetratricopeptide (TPR) repeat protein